MYQALQQRRNVLRSLRSRFVMPGVENFGSKGKLCEWRLVTAQSVDDAIEKTLMISVTHLAPMKRKIVKLGVINSSANDQSNASRDGCFAIRRARTGVRESESTDWRFVSWSDWCW